MWAVLRKQAKDAKPTEARNSRKATPGLQSKLRNKTPVREPERRPGYAAGVLMS